MKYGMQHIPNLLSLSRIFIAFFLLLSVYVFKELFFGWLFWLTFIGVLTDFLDGFIARRFHLTSSLGLFLDTLADKIFVVTVLMIFLYLRWVPLWFIGLVTIREFSVMFMKSYLKERGQDTPPLRSGKLKMIFQSFFICLLPYQYYVGEASNFYLILLRISVMFFIIGFSYYSFFRYSVSVFSMK